MDQLITISKQLAKNKKVRKQAKKGLKLVGSLVKNKIKQPSKSLSRHMKDLILSDKPQAVRSQTEVFRLALYPDERSVSRPIYRQATRAVYVKNITKFSCTTDAVYAGFYMSINPWSIVNTFYTGNMNGATSISTTSTQNITNTGTYVAANFKSYRVIAAKVTIVNRQAPLNAVGLLQIAQFDSATDPTINNIPNTVNTMQQCERYADVEVPHMTTIFIPQNLTDRAYSSTAIGSAAYPGDMTAIFMTGAPANTVVMDIIIEQDLELEPSAGTFYSNLANSTEISHPELHGKLDSYQDKLLKKVYYSNENECYDIIGCSIFPGGQKSKGSKMKFN